MTAPAAMQPTTCVREPSKIVGDILAAELGLSAGQVMQEDQKFDIPPTQAGLYISLGYVGPGKTISVSSA